MAARVAYGSETLSESRRSFRASREDWGRLRAVPRRHLPWLPRPYLPHRPGAVASFPEAATHGRARAGSVVTRHAGSCSG